MGLDDGEGTIGQMKRRGRRGMRKDKEEGEEGPEGRWLCSGKYWTIKHELVTIYVRQKKNSQKGPSPPLKKKRGQDLHLYVEKRRKILK